MMVGRNEATSRIATAMPRPIHGTRDGASAGESVLSAARVGAVDMALSLGRGRQKPQVSRADVISL